MSRAVLLPTPGDPLLLSEWLRCYRNWGHLVDQLYVMITWPQEYDILQRCYADVHEVGGSIIIPPVGAGKVDHGVAIDMMLPGVEETHVVLMEDDVYVRVPDALNNCFALIESGDTDVIGSPRGSASMEIVNAGIALGHPDGAALWPHLLFSNTQRIRLLQEGFTTRTWQAGETVLGLDHVCSTICYSDTGVAATMELRASARVGEIVSDVGDNGDPSWFHVGSLSTGPMRRHADGDTPEEAARRDPSAWARRNAWWRWCLEQWPGGLDSYVDLYQDAVNGLSEICGPYEGTRRGRYETLVTW